MGFEDFIHTGKNNSHDIWVSMLGNCIKLDQRSNAIIALHYIYYLRNVFETWTSFYFKYIAWRFNNE